MRVFFAGRSHLAIHLSEAAALRGHEVTPVITEADIAFIAEDTPTRDDGYRLLDYIAGIAREWRGWFKGPMALVSQVPPGFTRSLGLGFHYQADTLRLLDARERALNPEMVIFGTADGGPVPEIFKRYYEAFRCPVLGMTLEEAEFTKVAINCFLKAQVETTCELAAAAKKMGAKWGKVANALAHDSRIGAHAYLNPGRWDDSPHLVRDWRTLREMLA